MASVVDVDVGNGNGDGQTSEELLSSEAGLFETRRWITVEDHQDAGSVVASLGYLLVAGGLALAILYAVLGVLLLCTVVLAPFGRQLIKLAQLALSPFGRTLVVRRRDRLELGAGESFSIAQSSAHAPAHTHGENSNVIVLTDPLRGCCRASCCCACRSCCRSSSRREEGRGMAPRKSHVIANILWFPLGLPLAIVHGVLGLVFFCFAREHWMLARMAIAPFGLDHGGQLDVVEHVVRTTTASRPATAATVVDAIAVEPRVSAAAEATGTESDDASSSATSLTAPLLPPPAK